MGLSEPEEHRPPRAVLWDFDGTLIRTTEYHWRAWRETLAAENFTLTRERFAESFGRRDEASLRGYLGANLSEGEIRRISGAKDARYLELVKSEGVELLPGVSRWLGQLKARGWRQAVASSAALLIIESVLDRLGIGPYFDAVVGAENVERGKPHPDVFLAAAARIRVTPARCIVIEDAPSGVEAARRAGMPSVGVLSTHAALHADRVVLTLEELPDDALEELMCDRPP